MVDILGAVNFQGIISVIMKALIGIVVATLLFLVFKVMRQRKQFKYEAEIYEQDNLGHLNAYKDRFGIILNKKTNMEMGRLQKSKDWIGLSDMNYSLIRSGKKVVRRVSLLRLGEGQYLFLKPHINNPDGVFHLNLTREDVDWGINAFVSCTQTYIYKDRLKEMAPLFIMGLMVIGIVILGVFILQKFTPLIEALKSTGAQIVEATANLKAASFAQSGVIQ